MITEDEERQFLKNEEKLWDMAAITSAATLLLELKASKRVTSFKLQMELAAQDAYDLADALMAERRKRLKLENPTKS